MRFLSTSVSGAYVVESSPSYDERGSFSRVFCADEFLRGTGVDIWFRHVNCSFNLSKHTLRGMHWQAPPFEEYKLVRVSRGAIWDVIVDVRPGSPTYLKSFETTLWANEGRQLFVPPECAHGFMTLVDDTEVLYFLDNVYDKKSERGFNYHDPDLGLRWPYPPAVISERDSHLPNFDVRMAK